MPMFLTRALYQAFKKTSTGLVGLPVNPNARKDLIGLYQQTLESIKIIPENAFYRTSVEKITKYRLSVVESTEDEDVIEEKINCGQLEELIEQAKDELSVIPVYAENKLWEGFAPVKSEESS